MPEQLARYTVTLRDGRQVYKDLPASWDKAQVRAAFAQDMAAEGIDSRAQMVLDGPQGHSASSYEPSLKEKAASLASMAFAPVAVDQHHADRIGGRLADLLDWSPVGAAFGIDEGAGELGRGLRNGDVAAGVSGLAMMALSGVPEARQGAKGIRGLLANEDGAIRAWHGGRADFDKFEAGHGQTAHDLYFTPFKEDAQHYGRNLYEVEIDDSKMLDLTRRGPAEYAELRRAFDEGGMSDWFEDFDDFVDAIDSGDMYQRFASQHAQNDMIGALSEQGYPVVKMPDAGFGGAMSESYVVTNPSLVSILNKFKN